MALVNTKNKENELIGLGGKIEFKENGLNQFFLKQQKLNGYTFSGNVKQIKADEIYQGPTHGAIFWDISRFEKLTITFKDENGKPLRSNQRMERELTKEILEREKGFNTKFYQLYMEAKNMKNESAIDEAVEIQYKGEEKKMIKEENKTVSEDAKKEVAVGSTKPNIPQCIKDFIKDYNVTNTGKLLEMAINMFNESKIENVSLKETLELAKNKPLAVRELTAEEIQELVAENIPSEYVEAVSKVSELEEILAELKEEKDHWKNRATELFSENDNLTADNKILTDELDEVKHEVSSKLEAASAIANIKPEDPDHDPKGGQPLPVDYSVLKAELKADIIAELREEFKASLSAPVITQPKIEQPIQQTKEEIKKTTNKLNLPVAKESNIDSKKEEPKPQIKKEEINKPNIQQKKKIDLDTITYEELSNESYQTLQKIGKVLSLGEANVAKKDELIDKIAAKLNLTKVSVNTTNSGMQENKQNLNIKKTTPVAATVVDYASMRQNNTTVVDETNLSVDELLVSGIEKTEMDELANATFDNKDQQDFAKFLLGNK